MLHENPSKFRCLVDASLERHFKAIKRLVEHGTYFFDYGNSFMKAVYDAGVSEIARDGDDKNRNCLIMVMVRSAGCASVENMKTW